ncbi:TPA: DUF1642 domain-containing protein [Listeria innocua]|uniref:DUF1642 domain-containing protein n=1 Tax=Listeria TaxID=1637 RepID=UPI00182FC7B1|nr:MULTISPECIES: DUF1642 domain-containing protein [Listeria]EAH4447244.1 DUF1642 domain-containing protein [Listeria innocua]ELD8290041.1 DUF1642 domain-containing protein [Listeria innocua]ELD8310841.1 DUF1642 domain-containing protein [Listeria innocua]ELD8324603.1 DUF1642 domain-containing protein [Listeria innocua]ELD8330629.1 DUF1642 domain-containing protein [Listeria innocua]
MNLKVGDRVELILRSKKRVGTVEEVYNDIQKCKVQIDEFPVTVTKPQKYLVKAEGSELVVPQCVADWYEDNKGDIGVSIWQYIFNWEYQDKNSAFYEVMSNQISSTLEMLFKMQGGYKGEKEALYYVRVIDNINGYLNFSSNNSFLGNAIERGKYKTKFTEAEIKAMDKGEAYWLLREPVEEAEGEA